LALATFQQNNGITDMTCTERNFEEHVEVHLLSFGYHAVSPSEYDKERCLLPAEVLAFIEAAQPQAYQFPRQRSCFSL
jgi:hypothetical protein